MISRDPLSSSSADDDQRMTRPERRYIFLDEAGDLDFTINSSKYFVISTATVKDYTACHALMHLARTITWEGYGSIVGFHAKDDPTPRRKRVFDVISQHQIRFDFTLFEKRKTIPSLHDRTAFYKHACYRHLRHIMPIVTADVEEVMITTADLTLGKQKKAAFDAISDVVRQTCQSPTVRVRCVPAIADAGLQIADYGAWATQRKWESGDNKWRSVIADLIATEFDYYMWGNTRYY